MVRTTSPGEVAHSYNLRKEHEGHKKILGPLSTRFSLPAFARQVEKLSCDQRAAIERVGFGSLLCMPNYSINRALIDVLIDKWSSSKRAFLVAGDEISISPMDVALIMGLPVNGKPVRIGKEGDLVDLEDEYVNSPSKRKIAISTLERELDGEIGNGAKFIRTFLLYTFGVFLFPNLGRVVDGHYMSYLRNVDAIKEYAWGLALLEHLTTWIKERKDNHKTYIGGCLILLQIWSLEHLNVARPKIQLNSLTFPRACRWEESKTTTTSKIKDEFQRLTDDEIIRELQPTAIEMGVDIIKEALATRIEPQETAAQSRTDDDIDVEIESLVDKMERAQHSQKDADQLLEELREKRKQEVTLREEKEALRDSLRLEKQESDRLKALLQAATLANDQLLEELWEKQIQEVTLREEMEAWRDSLRSEMQESDRLKEHVQYLSKALEDSHKNSDQLLEELREKQKQEVTLREDMEARRDSLRLEMQESDRLKEHVQYLSKALEDSQKNADQLLKELWEKQMQEVTLREEMEALRDSLRLEKQESDCLQVLCHERDTALQAAISEKRSLEAKLTEKKDLLLANNQVVQNLQEELKARCEYAHEIEEIMRRAVIETATLEHMMVSMEREIVDKGVLKAWEELEELREMKEDIDKMNEQAAAILNMQGGSIS